MGLFHTRASLAQLGLTQCGRHLHFHYNGATWLIEAVPRKKKVCKTVNKHVSFFLRVFLHHTTRQVKEVVNLN